MPPRRVPNLVITIPPRELPPPKNHCKRTRHFIRIFPWVVGCIIVLWVFILRADNPPLRAYSPQPHLPVDGYKPRPFRLPHSQQVQSVDWSERADSIRQSFLHAFTGYKSRAAPYDELLPVSGDKVNNLNGWSLTLFDSLDTMLAMGLHDVFKENLQSIVRTSFSTPEGQLSLFYDTVVHHLGALLSAYAFSKEPTLLTRADDLGRTLLPAFNSASGIPFPGFDTKSGNVSMNGQMSVSLAQIMSVQMEFKYLAYLTGRPEYYKKAENVMTGIYNAETTKGMLATMWDPKTGIPSDVGEYAQTVPGYLLKQWALTAGIDRRSLDLYLSTVNGIIENLLYITPKRNLLYVTDIQNGTLTHRFDHLSCALPSVLTLGVELLGVKLPLRDRELHLWAAQGLAYTCWVTYADQLTGLGPEEVQMDRWVGVRGEQLGLWMNHVKVWEGLGKKGNGPPGTEEGEIFKSSPERREYTPIRPWYLLKPELVESFYMLWKTTKNERWRERGWLIYEAIEKHARTRYGYAGVLQVDQLPTPLKDEMPSYFLAQTLKYLYLLFSAEDNLPLDGWVFNAGGHPLPVFEWNAWEREDYNITSLI